MFSSHTLELFVHSLKRIGDPRSKQGVLHHFQTILASTAITAAVDVARNLGTLLRRSYR